MILRALKNIIIILTLSCVSSSCVFEDLPVCSTQNVTLQFTYKLNPTDSDLFEVSASHIDVYIFDRNGVYVQTGSGNIPTSITGKYSLSVNLPEGEYTFLGVGYKDSFFEVGQVGKERSHLFESGLTPGETRISDFRIRSKYDEEHFFPYNIESLLKGRIQSVQIKSGPEQLFEMPVIQNKNRLNIRLTGLPDTEYQPILLANNGRYDFENNIPADAQEKIYTPKWNADTEFYFFDILRLVEGQQVQLILIDKKVDPVKEFKATDLITEIMKSPNFNT
ncbi:MAG: FimB/Mfa2 family fimbrial subunit, partial [Bacteroidales bacterium]